MSGASAVPTEAVVDTHRTTRERRPRTHVGVLLGVLLAVVGFAATPAAGAPRSPQQPAAVDSRNPACYGNDAGPAGSLGDIGAGAPTGVYLWLDAAAWHIRVTHPGGQGVAFTGQMRACSPIHVATTLMQEGDSVLRGGVNQSALQFRLYDTGQLDGFEFNAACPTTWTFSFAVDGQSVPPSEIFIGNPPVHPSRSTFALPSCNLAGSTFSPAGALLALDVANASWSAVDLPLQPRLLYGDPNAPRSVAPARTSRSLWHDVVGSLATVLEAALVLALLGAWLMTRRQKRIAA